MKKRVIVSIVAIVAGLSILPTFLSTRAKASTHTENFRVTTDNLPRAKLACYAIKPDGPARGTLILCHGYNSNKERYKGWSWVAENLHWNLVAFDFREHGASTKTRHLCSLGYYEIYDVKAVVDWADAQGLEKPYAIYGSSMGASVGLRWASMDPRISGVFAVSPFANAYNATGQFVRWKLKAPLINPALFTWGFRKMLKSVDIPSALSKRDDLRLTILAGSRDCFPPAEQKRILDASKSPDSLKRLVIAPGMTHGTLWSWKGDRERPSHDSLLKEFLSKLEE